MILNVFTIVMLFIAACSAVMSLVLGISATAMYRRWGKPMDVDERIHLENRMHLVLLVTVVILAVRMLSWPLFYATLQSFVHEVEGAMCMAGVIEVDHVLANLLQILKPVVFFAIGFWLMLNAIDKKTTTGVLASRKLGLLIPISVMILADSIGDVVYLLKINPGTLVACCTTIFDIETRTTAAITESALGETARQSLWYLFYGSNLLLLAGIAAAILFGVVHRSAVLRRTVLGGLAVFAWAVNGPIVYLASFEVIAPTLLGLPFHHCIYDMLFGSEGYWGPWSGLPSAAAFLLGTLSVGWAFAVDLTGRTGEADEIGRNYVERTLKGGALGLSVCLILLTAHLTTIKSAQGTSHADSPSSDSLVRCAQDGVVVDPDYQVIVSTFDGYNVFCSVNDAQKYISSLPEPPFGVLVTDEITGDEIPSSNAIFIRSNVITVKTADNNIHVFSDSTAAVSHTRQYEGEFVADPLIWAEASH